MPRLPADKRNARFRAMLFVIITGSTNVAIVRAIFCQWYQRLMEKGDKDRAESMINRPLFRYTAYVFGKLCLSLFFCRG